MTAESVVLMLTNSGEIRSKELTVRAGGVSLTSDGRRSVIGGHRAVPGDPPHPPGVGLPDHAAAEVHSPSPIDRCGHRRDPALLTRVWVRQPELMEHQDIEPR